MVAFYRNIYKNIPEAELERRFKLRQASLDSLISREVILQEARAKGIQVSAQEVRDKITGNSAFQENGTFSRDLYLQVVRSVNQTPEQFENSQRADLLIAKVEGLVKEGVKVTDAEAREEFRRTRDKVSLEYVLVPLANYADTVTVAESEISARFEKDRRRYFVPDKIRVEYVRIDAGAMPGGAAPTDAEIADYYAQHSSEFSQQHSVRARHILFKLDPGAPPEEEAKIKDRAAMVLGKARAGTDFAALAREFSQDGSGPGGGDLGFFAREQMVPSSPPRRSPCPRGASATW